MYTRSARGVPNKERLSIIAHRRTFAALSHWAAWTLFADPGRQDRRGAGDEGHLATHRWRVRERASVPISGTGHVNIPNTL
eukprot:4143454-Pleurochrysis_carterae.AAC.1